MAEERGLGAVQYPRLLLKSPIIVGESKMTVKKKLGEVFKTVGLPPYTYVKPPYFGEVRADIEQPGKHLLIEGPSGIGKTCVIYKVFEELKWEPNKDYVYVSCRDSNANQRIELFLKKTESNMTMDCSVLIIDDFHLLPNQRRAEIGSRLKRLSDRAFEVAEPPKVALIGIPTAGISLLSDAYDLGPRIGIYRFKRADDREISKLIGEGESALNVLFEDDDIILSESQGNFWLAQYICNKICASKDITETREEVEVLSFDLLSIRRRLMEELSPRCMPAAKTFCKGKKWRPGGNKPYLEVLVALTQIPDSVVTFDKILTVVPERRKPGIKAIRPRIPEVIYDSQKNIDLRKQMAFDPDTPGFSIEDPLFRYFLSNLDPEELYKELGIEVETVEESKIYSYDVSFSFAGEVRPLVEAINAELKSEDVVTFYDYDQQSFLLALDLEPTLRRIYSEACQFYLIFLDKNYREKVWTKYERDIVINSGRQEHIIPVILDDEGAAGAVGIPSTLTRIDLRDVWRAITKSNELTEASINVIRNRCVLPLIERIGSIHHGV